MVAYHVSLENRRVDTVYYVQEKKIEDVKKSLIEFDKYPSSVQVEKERV